MGALALILPVLGPLLETVLSRVIPDPRARQRAIQELYDGLRQADLSQLEVNKVEAAHGSIFVAGWRPFIGWVLGSALAYQYLVAPISVWFSYAIGYPIPSPPTLDGSLWELMFGLLGMGALRSFDKLKGTTTTR